MSFINTKQRKGSLYVVTFLSAKETPHPSPQSQPQIKWKDMSHNTFKVSDGEAQWNANWGTFQI